MSPSAEHVQDTADLESRVDDMVREASDVADDDSIVRQSARRGLSGGGVETAVEEAVEDAAGRRSEGGSDTFEDVEAVLGDVGAPDSESDFDAASIDDLDAALAEMAEAVAGEPVIAPHVLPDPDPIDAAGHEPVAAPTPAVDMHAAATLPAEFDAHDHEPAHVPATPSSPPPAAAEPKAEAPAPAVAPAEPATPPLAALLAIVEPAVDATLGRASRRLERLSPAARHMISWAAFLTTLNAAAVWTVVLIRASSAAVLPVAAGAHGPEAAEKTSAKAGGDSHAAEPKKPSKTASKSTSKKAATGKGGH